MHSASLNPWVASADRFGFTYRKGTFGRHHFVDGKWRGAGELPEAEAFWATREAAIGAAGHARSSQSLADLTDYDSPRAGLADYWTSIATSADPDEVAVEDLAAYNDTAENCPLKAGFGAPIARHRPHLPVPPTGSAPWR